MSIARLWTHIVRIYREPDATGARDTQGFVRAAPASIGAAPTVNNARPDQSLVGALTGPQGWRHWFLDKTLTVLDRDVLSVIGGAETGLKFRVERIIPVQNARGVTHHWEVIVSEFDGQLAA